jgi:hypothetical protein
MYGKFQNNKLKALDVVGNSEVIFFIRDEFKVLVGIDKTKSSKNIFITLGDNQIETVDFIQKPDGKTFPPSEFEKLKENEKILKGFIWREDERPLTKEAIFIHDDIIKPDTDKQEQLEINQNSKN